MASEKKYNYKSDESRNATLLIGILLIAVILVGGGLLYIIMQKQGPGATGPAVVPNQTGNLTNQTPVVLPCDAVCLYQKALASLDAAMCANLSVQFVQPCYENLSSISLDACKAVSNASKKQACLTAAAISSDDISLCDLAADRNTCRNTVNPCGLSAHPALCSALARNDPTKCASDAQCLINYSITKGNASSCGLINNSVAATACTSAVSHIDACGGLNIQAQKDYCNELYAMYTNDYMVCTGISSDSSYSLDCFSSFAANMHNYSVCRQDGLSVNTLWQCYTNYSLATGDIGGCQQIDPLATTSVYACASAFANKFGNPAACNVITDTLTQRATCYQGAILYSNQNLNWSYCAGVMNADWKNECYRQAARIDNDPSICNYATPAYAVQNCLNALAANQTK